MTLPVGSISGTLRLLGVAEFQQGVIGAQRSMNMAAGSAERMAASVDQADAALAGSARAASAASVGSAKMRAAQLTATAATERYNAVLTDGNATLARRASAEASMIRANERVAASERSVATASAQANSELFAAEGRFKSLTKTAAGLGLAFGAFEVAKKAIDITKEAADYQRSMTMIRTLTGASADEVKQMSSALLGLAGKVAQSPEDLATSLYHMESVGLSGAKALNAVTIAAKGAKIGNADLEDTTNALTSTIASGIAKNQNYAKTMSQLLTIVGTGDMKLTDFNESLSSGLLAIMATAGVSLRDVGAALAVFGDNNIRGARAATMLRVAVQAMQAPMAKGATQLDALGIKTSELKDDLAKGGLNLALSDLKAHLDKAGVSGKQTGAILVDIFGKRANSGIAVLLQNYTRLQQKYDMLDRGAQTFGQRWSEVSKTASFQFSRLGHEAEAAGISIAEKATPALGAIATLLAGGVKFGLSVAQDALKPFASGWHLLATGVSAATGPLRAVGGVLSPLAPLLKGVGSAALAMFLAFKGYQLARTAVYAVMDASAVMSARVKNSFADVRLALDGTASESKMVAMQFEADMAAMQAATLKTVAAQDRAAALEAQAFADQTAASSAATDAQVADADTRAAAALTAARVSAEAAAASAAAAEEASATIVASGDAAKIGWAGVLGPIGLAAIGVLAVVSMFHKSTTASQEATAAAKAYTDALSGGGGKAPVIDAIVKQLSDNKVPETLAALNKELGRTAFTGSQFATAIEKGGAPLDTLRTRLQGIIDKGTILQRNNFGAVMGTYLTPAAQKASDALKHLNTQYGTLTKSAQKELLDAKSFGVAASSVDKLTKSTQVGSDTAKQYATMSGIVVDKNGIAAVSSKTLAGAVNNVKDAYNTASQSGDQFLAALKTFSGTAGTAADRAALIGATLKAANGDALNFAAQMNNAATADRQFATDVKSAAKNAKESTRGYLDSIINLKTGTIDYSKTAAGPLISDLQSIQNAAMQAAQAQFQHAKATESGKKAADQAYKVYKSQTQGALISEAKQLGLTKDQAKKLADQYFGMPKKVKTLIEQEGADPIVTVLNKIGKQLSYLTGHPWRPKITLDTTGVYAQLANLRTALRNATGNVATALGHAEHNLSAGHNAAGTMNWRGGLTYLAENGPELVELPRGSKVYPNNSPQTQAALHGNDQRPVNVTVVAPQTIDPDAVGWAAGRHVAAALGL